VDANLAVVTALAGVAEVDVDGFSTTALGVLDCGTLLLARSALLADAAVLHLVVEVEVGIVVNRDVDVGDGETLLLLVAAEGSRLLLATLVGDGLLSEVALRDVVPLAELLGGALPVTAEVEVVVLAWLVAVVEVGPVVATLLLLGTFVVVVPRGVVVGSLTVPVGSDLLGGQAGD
jgi:hypothetical protein